MQKVQPFAQKCKRFYLFLKNMSVHLNYYPMKPLNENDCTISNFYYTRFLGFYNYFFLNIFKRKLISKD